MQPFQLRPAGSRAVLFAILIVWAATTDASELSSIFNGQDFSGWQVPENNIWWHAEDGLLKVRSGPKKQSSILWTEKAYANFVMQFEFKFGDGVVDSGIFVRDVKEQIQLGISGSLKRDMTGSPYISGKGYPSRRTASRRILG